MKFIVSLFVLLFSCTFVFGNQSKTSLFFEDTSNTLTISEVSNPDFQNNFTPITSEVNNQTFSTSTYWFRLTKNKSTQPYHIVFENLFLDSIQLYTLDNNQWVNEISGLLTLPHKSNKTLLHSFAFTPTDSTKTYFLSVKSNCLFLPHFEFVEDGSLMHAEGNTSTFYTVIGIVIMVYFLGSLFFFTLSRKKGLLFLGLYALATLLLALYMNGFIFQWFLTENLIFYKWSFAWTLNFFSFTAMLFSYYLFDIKLKSKKLTLLYYVSFIILTLLTLSPLVLDRLTVSKIHFFLSSLPMFLNMFVGSYIGLKEKDKTAIHFAIGWFIYFSCSVIWSIGKMGLIEKSFFVENSTAFGFIAELCVFAFVAGKYYAQNVKKQKELENQFTTINKQKTDFEEKYGEKIRALSTREMQVLELVSKGLLDKEIADQLDVSLPSVRTYCSRIFRKLGVSNRTEASKIYHNLEFIRTIPSKRDNKKNT